jgi:penicillin-binding protein 1B
MDVTLSTVAGFLKKHRRPILFGSGALVLFLFGIHYSRLWRTVGERLSDGVFANTIGIYTAPKTLLPGAILDAEAVTVMLWRAGYSEKEGAPAGTFEKDEKRVLVRPGPGSRLKGSPAEIQFDKGKIVSIADPATGKKLQKYTIDPQLLSNLSGSVRERRRLIRQGDMPKVLKDALLAVEDRNFYTHHGFDLPRLAASAWNNLRSGTRGQGGSTLTMQLARNIWLSPEKTWTRKFNELLIAMILEQRLTKDQILEHYANQAYLGNYDSFEIHGFGEAAWRYFNCDVGELTLTQAALLAGIIQRPNYFSPHKYPDRALERRNLVLTLMEKNGMITAGELTAALKAPLDLNPRTLDRGDAPYLVDLALNEAQRIAEARSGSVNLFTTVDPELQAHATEAVRIGMQRLDKLLADRKKTREGDPPQVALVALDAQTGEVRAAVGGRNYGKSQLNRVLAKRQPGSVFKPFVYAAALETQLNRKGAVFTGATLLSDEPTTFKFGDEIYEPGNFGGSFRGPVLLRRALTSSLNIPTVAVAQQVGYKRVADLAKRAGLETARGTPAVALGAYDATPLDIAGAYTVFPNSGDYLQPTFLSSIENLEGQEIYRHQVTKQPALDPRVNWMMLDMLQDVVRYGTGGSVWSFGVKAPIAGKTGTSRDGWFAGFTSSLICVVWVGYDDHSDLDLEGAKSALPVWAEFIKRATAGGAYSKPFPPPPAGLTSVEIDTETGEVAGPASEKTRVEYFIAGREPQSQATAESIDAVRLRKEEELPLLIEAKLASQGGLSFKPPTKTASGGAMGTANWFRPKTGDGMIAASPSLPSGAKVRVTNVSTGKSVVVTIAGRIPVESGYVLSLAHQAASELDFVRAGSAQVRVDPVN